MPPGGNKFKG